MIIGQSQRVRGVWGMLKFWKTPQTEVFVILSRFWIILEKMVRKFAAFVEFTQVKKKVQTRLWGRQNALYTGPHREQNTATYETTRYGVHFAEFCKMTVFWNFQLTGQKNHIEERVTTGVFNGGEITQDGPGGPHGQDLAEFGLKLGERFLQQFPRQAASPLLSGNLICYARGITCRVNCWKNSHGAAMHLFK